MGGTEVIVGNNFEKSLKSFKKLAEKAAIFAILSRRQREIKRSVKVRAKHLRHLQRLRKMDLKSRSSEKEWK